MPSKHEQFWTLSSFAFVGHSAKKPFPVLSFREARNLGKTVFPVDPSVDRIDDSPAYPDLESLPEKVEAAVLESPKEETEGFPQTVAGDLIVEGEVKTRRMKEKPAQPAFVSEYWGFGIRPIGKREAVQPKGEDDG